MTMARGAVGLIVLLAGLPASTQVHLERVSRTPAAMVAATPGPPVGMRAIEVCPMVPEPLVSQALGRPLTEPPRPFRHDPLDQESGCRWEAGDDAAGRAVFAYAVLAPEQAYRAARARAKALRPVPGFGDEAFFTAAADAEQLWILVRGRAAILVAVGELPNPAAAKRIAPLLLAQLR